MIRNYFITAIRNILRFKLHSAISIGGLSFGISIFTLIILYVVGEFSYNKYNENYDKIYQVSVDEELETTARLGHSMQENFPEIQHMLRIDGSYGGGRKAFLSKQGAKEAVEFEDIIFADSSFFNVFTVKVLSGDILHALNNPYSLILTESSAKKMFGRTDVVNSVIEYVSSDGRVRHDFTITAVIENVPATSSIKYTAVASFITLSDIKPAGIDVNQDYYNWGYYTYLMFHDNVDPVKFAEKARNEYIKFLCETYDIDPDNEKISTVKLDVVPLAKVTFYGNNKLQFLSLIILLGVFILLIAIINFINLSLAKSSLRAREIGLRKVAGSSRKNLISQYIGEAIVFVLIASVVSIIFTEILKPLFNKMVDKELKIGYIENPEVLLIFIGGAIVVGILAGFYPAIVLSRFNPIKTLKNEVSSGKIGIIFKQSLSIIQITISLVLIIGVLLISKQLNYLKTKDLGFDNKNIIYFISNDAINEKYDLFKQRILENPAIYNISRAGNEFGEPYHISVDEEFNGVSKTFQLMVADPDFVETMGLEVVEGRNYLWDRAGDIGGMIINETAAREFGLDSIIGFRMSKFGGHQQILGIYKDVHNESFHKEIAPCVLMNYSYMLHKIMIKINRQNEKAAIDHIERIWNEFVPDLPFQYNFLDDKYDKLYERETKFNLIIKLSALFSIILACLGLFGMVSYNSERRKKEIGIRKSIGASTGSILFLLNTGIIKWVGISTIFACPIAYYALDNWLQNFAFRTNINIGVFILAVLIVLSISILSVSLVVLKAARTNPADCLRSE